MDNLVGDNLPSAEKFKALLKKLQEVRQEIAKLGVILPAEERRRRLRLRKNAQQYVPLLLSLVNKYKVETPMAPLAGMQSDARLAAELSPFEDEAGAVEQLVADTLVEAEHELAQGFLLYYGILQHMAERIPELAVELKPLREFMAQSRRQPRTPAPAPAPVGG